MTAYLIGNLYLTCVWAIVYLLCAPHNRREMLAMSVLGGLVGIVGGVIYTYDWWHPELLFPILTPLGTFGLEDIIFGAAVFGIASVIGEVSAKEGGAPLRSLKESFSTVLLWCGISLVGILVLVYGLGLHTFFSSLIVTLGVFCLVSSLHPAGILSSFKGGILTTVVALPSYLIPLWYQPSFIQDSWYLEKLSGNLVYGIPVEEFIWFFTTSALIAIVWEHARGLPVG